MKVTNEQNINNAVEQSANTKEFVSVRSFNELAAGDRFKASILDIHPNQVTLKLASGDTLTAKSLILPDARIGEETIFMVKENFKGQILLEMVKPEDNSMQNNIVKESLGNAGIYATDENMEMVRGLMDAGLPLDKSTLQKAAFFKYSDGSLSMDKILFLLKEDLPMTENNITILNNIAENNFELSKNIKNIVADVFKLDDTPLKAGLMATILDGIDKEALGASLGKEHGKIKDLIKNNDLETIMKLVFDDNYKNENKEFLQGKKLLQNNIEQAISSKLFINLKGKDSYDEFKNYFSNLDNTVTEMQSRLMQSQHNSTALTNNVAYIKDSLQFMTQVNNFKEYFQIPFAVNGRETHGELHVFKDSKGQKNFAERASVLISLDNAYIGRVQVFVSKSQKNLALQFSCETDNVIELVNKNISALKLVLSEKGYTMSGVALKKLDKNFAITDDKPSDLMGDGKVAAQVKRYSFDMRV